LSLIKLPIVPVACRKELNGGSSVVDFLLGFAFVAMILSPPLVASLLQRVHNRKTTTEERAFGGFHE
jgi:hypothetical protein